MAPGVNRAEPPLAALGTSTLVAKEANTGSLYKMMMKLCLLQNSTIFPLHSDTIVDLVFALKWSQHKPTSYNFKCSDQKPQATAQQEKESFPGTYVVCGINLDIKGHSPVASTLPCLRHTLWGTEQVQHWQCSVRSVAEILGKIHQVIKVILCSKPPAQSRNTNTKMKDASVVLFVVHACWAHYSLQNGYPHGTPTKWLSLWILMELIFVYLCKEVRSG